MDNTRTICNIISLTANAVVDAINRCDTLDQALNHLNNTECYGYLSSEVKKHFEHVVSAYTADARVSECESDMVRSTYWVVGEHYGSKQIISVQCPQDKFDKLVRMGFEKTKGDAIYDGDHGTITVPYFVHVPIINPGDQVYKIM